MTWAERWIAFLHVSGMVFAGGLLLLAFIVALVALIAWLDERL